MDKELLHTYFRGEATPEEEKQIMDWAESSPENYQEYLKERKIWNAILMYSVNPTIKATATHKRLFLSLYKYAAIAVIAFGVPVSSVPHGHFRTGAVTEQSKIYRVRSRVVLLE